MEKQTPDNNMAKGMTRTLTFNVYPQDSLKLTVLFNIVIGIIVSTPGGYLESPMKTLSAFSTASTPLQWRQWTEKRLTGMTLGLLDKRSREVTWRVWSSVHLTSSVNSTEHSGQKSSQVQSCRRIQADTQRQWCLSSSKLHREQTLPGHWYNIPLLSYYYTHIHFI